jgi:phosphohistidine phosphatase
MLLVILRHGKAEKDSPTGRDSDRPLTKRGRRQAEHIGKLLAHPQAPLERPTTILSSRAERAKHTATLVAEALGTTVTFEDTLSLGNPTKDALALIAKLAQHNKPTLIVGHNPQLEDLVAALTGDETGIATGELAAIDIHSGKHATGKLLARFRLDDED